MKSLLLVLPVSALFSLMSCSHFSRSSKTETRPVPRTQEAVVFDTNNLEELVVKAKASKSLVNYLATDLFLKGNMALLEGDFATASVLFKYVVALVPDDEFLQKKYAITLIRLGDLEGSQGVLKALYEKSREEKVGLILAGVYTGIDKEKEARAVYQQILKKNPKNEDACIFLSKSYALEKQTDQAMKLLIQCSKNDPKNGMFDYYIGKIHIEKGDIASGVTAFKKAHQRQPDLGAAVNALGIIYEESERHNEAIAVYRKFLKSNPADINILGRMVQALFVKEQYGEVIPYAERLSDLEPDNLNLKVKLGVLYTDAKQYSEAISVFKDLLKAAPESDKILYYLGAIHQELKELERSIEYFNQIPPSSGLYTDSSVQVANMLSTLAQAEIEGLKKGQWKEQFISHVNKKLEEFKDMRVEFSLIKSGYYEGLGQYKEAMETMAVVQDEKGFSTQHKYYLANLYEKEKKFEESTNLIMGILEKEPKNAHAWNFLGYAMLVRGEEMDKAYEYIQKALHISPNDGYIRDSLGWYYYKKGDVKKALAELETAFKKVPDDIEILKHLAEIHLELKNFPKAKTFLESALKNARYFSDRKEILSMLEELENDRLPASRELD